MSLIPFAIAASAVWALLYLLFLGYAVRSIAFSRRTSKGASRGSLGFLTKHFRDTTYFWILVISMKDLLFVVAPAIVHDGTVQLIFCGMLCLSYAFLTSVALPFSDNCANVI